MNQVWEAVGRDCRDGCDQMTPRERQILDYLLRSTGRRLGDAMAKLGGERARQGLLGIFDAALAESGLAAGDKPFQAELSAAGWDEGAAVLRAMTGHAASVVGPKTVGKAMTELLDETDARAGGNQYEIYFRLGLHGYRPD